MRSTIFTQILHGLNLKKRKKVLFPFRTKRLSYMAVLSVGLLMINRSHRPNLRLISIVSCVKRTEKCNLKFKSKCVNTASCKTPTSYGKRRSVLLQRVSCSIPLGSGALRASGPTAQKAKDQERNSCVPEHESFPDAASHDRRRLTACHFHVTSHRLLYSLLFIILFKLNTYANLFGYGK